MQGSKMNSFLAAFKAMLPIMTGIVPTGMAYALLAANAGIMPVEIIMTSFFVFAGSVQFLSIELIRSNMGYVQFALIVFLIHSRHMFFGLSLFDKFNKAPRAKPFLIFALTDETYAVMTNRGDTMPEEQKDGWYYIFLAILMHSSWNFGTVLGVVAAELITFNTAGMDFALTAMFSVIVLEQMKSNKNKLPFVIGASASVLSLIVIGSQSMLLGCCIISVIALLVLRKHIEKAEGGGAEMEGGA